jgi:hypothetical protein
VRLANVGRSLLSAAWLVALNAWTNDARGIHLVLWGVAAFLAGLVVFQGCDWWIKHRARGKPDPGPPAPLGGGEFGQSGRGDGGGVESG